MSLLVWLPLNGDLKNQGLEDITVTNNGATVNSAGKIGSCYSFDGSAHYLQFDKSLTNLYCGDFSWALWVKPTDDTRGILISEYSSTGSSNVALELLANRVIRVYWNGSPDWSTGKSITKDVWSHIAVTRKENVLKVYINGILVATKSDVNLANRISTSKIRIGDDYRGGTSVSYMGYLNDIRIYDHCLSPAEVKEISRGLVLHYKLDHLPINNLIPFNLSNDTYTIMDHANRTTGSISNKIYHVDGYQSDTSADTSFSIKSNTFLTLNADSDYYLSFYCKAANSISTLYFGVSGQAHTGLINSSNKFCYPSSQVNLGNNYEGYVVLKIHTGSDTQYKINIGFDVPNLFGIGSYMEFSNIMLTSSEPDLESTYFDNTILDSSGYNNNGTITGNITLSSPSPRYDSCTNLVNSYLTTRMLKLSETTISFWICRNSLTGTRQFIYTGWYGISIELTAGNGWKVYYTYNSGGSTVSCSPTTILQANTWYHCVLVIGSNGVKFYINGVLEKTATYQTPYYNTSTANIGNYSTYNNFNAKLSDFRIYATALSEEDVRQLYEVSSKIDNFGNLHSYEFIEEDTYKPIVQKNGIIKINNFIEQYNYLYLPSGTFINTELNYNAGDSCKAETVIRYESGGSGRDLMGYSSSGGGYWGVRADGYWEPHGTFTYTNTDITVKNNISYIFSSATEHGVYLIGALANTYTVRNKYIYHVKLYKNDILERDLYPAKQGNSIGLFDMITKRIYTANNSNAILGYDDQNTAKLFKDSIKGTELIEI